MRAKKGKDNGMEGANQLCFKVDMSAYSIDHGMKVLAIFPNRQVAEADEAQSGDGMLIDADRIEGPLPRLGQTLFLGKRPDGLSVFRTR